MSDRDHYYAENDYCVVSGGIPHEDKEWMDRQSEANAEILRRAIRELRKNDADTRPSELEAEIVRLEDEIEEHEASAENEQDAAEQKRELVAELREDLETLPDSEEREQEIQGLVDWLNELDRRVLLPENQEVQRIAREYSTTVDDVLADVQESGDFGDPRFELDEGDYQ